MAIDSERGKQVLVEWAIDPTKGVDGVKKLAKEIRDQQKVERDLTAIRKELGQQTDALHAVQERLVQATSRLGQTMTIAAGAVLGTALGKLATSMQDVIKSGLEYEHRMTEQIAGMEQLKAASGGLIGTLDLLRMKNRLAMQDYEFTTEDMAAMTKAAIVLGRAMQIDFGEAMDKVTTAVVQGGRALKQLGIQGEETGTASEKIGNRLKELGRKFGDLNISAKSSSEKIDVMTRSLKGALAELSAEFWKSETVKRFLDDTTEGFKMLALYVRQARGEIGYISKELRTMGPFGTEAGAKLAARAMGPFQVGSGLPGETTFWRPTVAKPGDADYKGPRGSTKSKEPGFYAPWSQEGGYEGLTDISGPSEQALFGPGVGAFGDLERKAGTFAEIISEMAKDQRTLERQQILVAHLGKDFLSLSDAELKAADAQLRFRTAAESAMDIQRQMNVELKDMAVNSLANFAGGMWNAADAAISSGQGIGTALLAMTKATLLGIAQQATVKAIMETAEGIAAQAVTWGVPNPASIMHFTAAGIFGGIAVTAGAAGLGMSAAMSSGGSGGASRGASAGGSSSMSPGARPTYGRTVEDNKPINVNVYLGDPTRPATAMLITRQVKAQLGKAA